MKTHALAALTACVLAPLPALSPHAAGAGPAVQWTIVETLPIPEGASGLAYDGTWLYCGIYGADGGRIYRIDPDTGDYTLLFTGPHEDAYGLAFDGQYLWTTDHPGSSSTPAVAMKLDWDGSLLDQIDLPAHYMSGIAADAGNFWVARYYPDPGHLYLVDGTGAVLDDFPAPDNQPWDLTVENGNLWMADYWGDALYQIDPATGSVLFSHPSEGTDPAGIVWDGRYLWYCDNGEGGVDFLYKVDLQGGGTPDIEIPAGTHDYGAVSIGDAVTWNAIVHNVGDADLEISDVTFSPGTDLSCPLVLPLVIPPASSALLPIEFAPTAFAALDATATVLSNAPVHPEVDLALSGHGVYPEATISVAESSHDFGGVRIGAHTRWFMEIANHGSELLTVSDIAIDDGRYYLDEGASLPIDIATLDSIRVGVWFNPLATAAVPATVSIYSNDALQNPATVSLAGHGVDTPYPMGQVLWSYQIDAGFDNSVKAIISIPDVSGDGVADVIVCSEDDFVRCFNGNAHGTGDVLWEHEIDAGPVYRQSAVQIMPDIDEDAYPEVIVGSAWGGRLVRAISGKTGDEVWTYDTRQYGDGGWVYQVDCRYDYNNDGSVDVLAATGDDATDTGPKRVHCLNGLTGSTIWNRPLGGPVFAVIGVEDFTGDGRPDVLAGASNEDETQGFAYGLDGVTGAIEWTFPVAGSSVWALAQIDDVTSDGVADVVVGDFLLGRVHGLDATDGSQEYVTSGFGTMTSFVTLGDVNADGHPDVIPAHFSPFARVLDGQTGGTVWTTGLVDKPASVARIADVSGDGIDDVVLGTLFSNNRAYFIDGATGGVLDSWSYGSPVDGIGAIPDIVGDDSWEMVVGGRNGLVTCYSGGLAVGFDPADVNQDGVVDFTDLLAVLSSWGPCPGCPEDIDNDGEVGFSDLLAVLSAWSPS